MMAFNDYFGYQQFKNPQKTIRKLKRTEFSLEKLADLSDNSKSKKKELVIPLLKNKTLKLTSPSKHNRNSLKKSPFRSIEKRQSTQREYGNKEKQNAKR